MRAWEFPPGATWVYQLVGGLSGRREGGGSAHSWNVELWAPLLWLCSFLEIAALYLGSRTREKDWAQIRLLHLLGICTESCHRCGCQFVNRTKVKRESVPGQSPALSLLEKQTCWIQTISKNHTYSKKFSYKGLGVQIQAPTWTSAKMN